VGREVNRFQCILSWGTKLVNSRLKMVLIEAYIKAFKLDDVKEALEELGVAGMTVVEVLQESQTRPRGRSFSTDRAAGDFVPKIKIEIAAAAHHAERIIEAICLHGSAGKTEDGRIVVRQVRGAVRIRTGETDTDALSF
jgi:nitrogen regulatory protein PII